MGAKIWVATARLGASKDGLWPAMHGLLLTPDLHGRNDSHVTHFALPLINLGKEFHFVAGLHFLLHIHNSTKYIKHVFIANML